MPEPITVSAVALAVAQFVAEHAAGHVVGGEAHHFYRHFLERWRESPKDPETGLPHNHDLENAGAEALREALFVLVMELAGRIEPKKTWLTNWTAKLPGGGILSKDIFPNTRDPHRSWLNGFRKIVAGDGVRTLHQTLKLEDGRLRECFTGGNVCQALGPVFADSVLSWAKFELAGSAEHPYFESLVLEGWELPGTAQHVTLAQAYCLFFREHLKTNPKVFHILVADTLSDVCSHIQSLGGNVTAELKALREQLDSLSPNHFASLEIDFADFQNWLDPQLGEIKELLGQAIAKLDILSDQQGEILVAVITLNTEIARGNEAAKAALDQMRSWLDATLDKLPKQVADELERRCLVRPSVTTKGCYVLVLSGSVKEMDRTRVEAIVSHLRLLSKDMHLTLEKIEDGSVRLVLRGTREGYERLRFLLTSGTLSRQIGVAVVSLENFEDLDLAFHDPKRDAHISPALHMLPPLPAGFVGRESDLAALRQMNPASGALITSLRGMGGVGKTALALVLAHEWAPRFPDAQLFLDARGTQADPPSARHLIEQVIQTFQPTIKLPDDESAVKAHFQSELKAKKVLLLVDNVRDAAQAAPLIPPQGCALIVTSRQNFLLGTTRAHTVGKLPDDQAVALLREYHPALTDVEAAELTRLCAGLPLALKLAGAHIALDASERDGWPDVTGYVRKLGSGRLATLDADAADANEITVSESLRLSEAQLPEGWREAWRKLGVFTTSFDSRSAQAVAGANEAMLGQFVRRSMLEREGDKRYKLHDLAADYARARFDMDSFKLVELAHAEHFSEFLRQAEKSYESGHVLNGLALFDQERVNIEAAQAFAAKADPQSEAAARLVIAFGTVGKLVLRLRLHLRRQLEWLSTSLRSAEKLGDREGEAACVGEMGVAYNHLGEARQAISCLEKQLTICREIGHKKGEGTALCNLSHVYYNLGEPHKAMELLEQDLSITREMGDRIAEAQVLGNLGVACLKLGDLDKSISLQEEALKLVRELGDRHIEGVRLTGLGHVYSAKGDAERAKACYAEAAKIARETGDKLNEAHALYNLATKQRESADETVAAELMEQARALYAACDSPIAADAEATLAQWSGDPRKLADCYERKLAAARQSKNRGDELDCLINLGDACEKLGELARSVEFTENGLVIARELGNRQSEGICLHNLGEFQLALGDVQKSRDYYAQSLTVATETGFRLLEANARWGQAQIEHKDGNVGAAISLAESALAIQEAVDAKNEAEKTRAALAQWRA